MSFINLDRKSLKGDITCKFCGLTGLSWVKSVNTRTGVELVNKIGKVHNCQRRGLNDIYALWDYFFEQYVYGPNAIENWKRSVDYRDGLTLVERLLRDRTPEEKQRCDDFIISSKKQSFNSK